MTANNFENLIPSPCVRSCCLDERNICMGCFRSLEEICRWSEADDELRLDILNKCQERRKNRHACG